MKDITQELALHNNLSDQDELDNFINGADQGEVKPKKIVNKYNHTTLAFNIQQREFFDFVKNEMIKTNGKKITTPKFLLFLWQYNLKKKCVMKDYIEYSLFISSNASKGDLKQVVTTWGVSLIPIKQQLPIAEISFGKIGIKGIVLLYALHFAKNELDIDLTPYLNSSQYSF